MADTKDELRHRLEENETRHLEARRQATLAMNARIRGVVDALDGGLSYGEVAKAMNAARERRGARPIRRGDLSHIVACGYPEDSPEEAVAS
ncbi:MAG: hypothetical protein JWM85_1116 [Acidimicrobiaceae bacterium]|nr:hypothetical protein [Acidimicrobiaceae bacterium]